jgi:hypothetical protein
LLFLCRTSNAINQHGYTISFDNPYQNDSLEIKEKKAKAFNSLLTFLQAYLPMQNVEKVSLFHPLANTSELGSIFIKKEQLPLFLKALDFYYKFKPEDRNTLITTLKSDPKFEEKDAAEQREVLIHNNFISAIYKAKNEYAETNNDPSNSSKASNNKSSFFSTVANKAINSAHKALHGHQGLQRAVRLNDKMNANAKLGKGLLAEDYQTLLNHLQDSGPMRDKSFNTFLLKSLQENASLSKVLGLTGVNLQNTSDREKAKDNLIKLLQENLNKINHIETPIINTTRPNQRGN